MKSKIKEKVKREPVFPCLMKRAPTGTIVLMIEKGHGIILSGMDVGYMSYSWIMSDFNPFQGSILLSND